jgi:hypothetical protein
MYIHTYIIIYIMYGITHRPFGNLYKFYSENGEEKGRGRMGAGLHIRFTLVDKSYIYVAQQYNQSTSTLLQWPS